MDSKLEFDRRTVLVAKDMGSVRELIADILDLLGPVLEWAEELFR